MSKTPEISSEAGISTENLSKTIVNSDFLFPPPFAILSTVKTPVQDVIVDEDRNRNDRINSTIKLTLKSVMEQGTSDDKEIHITDVGLQSLEEGLRSF